MKTLKATVKLITISIALVGMASVWAMWTAEGAGASQVNPNAYQILSAGPNGLASGQTLRLSVFNPNDPSLQDERETVRAQAQLSDERGNVIAASNEVAIPPGEFRAFDFHRNSIPLAGEAGTGRLQLRASCYVRVAVPEKKIDQFAASLEIIEDGLSNTVLLAEQMLPSRAGGSRNDFLTFGGIPVGLAHGQTLRFSVLNPNEPERTERRSAPVRAQVRLYDAQGNQIAQSAELTILPDQFRSFDFNRSALPLAGEPSTGHLQVRAEIEIRSPTFVQIDGRAVFPASLELVDNSTGQTAIALLLPAVQAAREAARRE